MKIQVRSKEQFKVSRWGGGTTTEFYLYPENGDYAARDFQVRISSATVELAESRFTKLPGVKRTLMLLEGEIRLLHEGRRERTLRPYEMDTFLGDWDTISYGQATDFNLMLKDGAKGSMFYFEVAPNTKADLQPFPLEEGGTHNQKLLIYVIDGQGQIETTALHQHCLAVIDGYQGKACRLENLSGHPLRLAVCHVHTGA